MRRALSAARCRFVPKCLICLALMVRFLGGLERRGLRLTRRGLLALVASRLTLVVVMTFHPVSLKAVRTMPSTAAAESTDTCRPGLFRRRSS